MKLYIVVVLLIDRTGVFSAQFYHTTELEYATENAIKYFNIIMPFSGIYIQSIIELTSESPILIDVIK